MKPGPQRIEDLDKNMKVKKVLAPESLTWISASDRRLTLRGLAWFRENRGRFCRLPLRAEGKVPSAVWSLAQCPSGAQVAFRSDTTALAARVTNVNTGFMLHMAMSGSNGLALQCGAPGWMRPWAVALPDLASPSFERQLFNGVSRALREFRLYLPLYRGLVKLELGFSPGARILPPSPTVLKKPVVFYGTSITQGGCTSTAADDYISILGRLLNIEGINLGFSGNGKGEPEMAELISEIDAALTVLDYAANVDADRLRNTLPGFVRILRKKHPTTPILLVTNVCFSAFDYKVQQQEMLETKRDIMFEFYIRQRQRGDRNLHIVDGFDLIPFGADSAFVDGVHPTSHGFRMMAERLVPVIERILFRDT